MTSRSIWIYVASSVLTAALAILTPSRSDGQLCHGWMKVARGPTAAFHEMAYDRARGVTVMFYRDETWEWDGAEWVKVATSGPPPRSDFAMVYDSRRRVTVLFGGQFGRETLEDTWEWDGVEWTLVAESGPRWRHSHAMAFDSARGVTVLFGRGILDNNTWEWDGVEWRQVADDGPALRHDHAMTFDSARGVTVLFGGEGVGYQSLGDTWEWDGIKWRKVADSGPSPRVGMSMSYDTNRGVTILIGGAGEEPGRSLNDTWEWDGVTWRLAAVGGPAEGAFHAIAYDERRAVTVLHGGHPDLSDTWEYRCAEPLRLRVNAACPGGGPLRAEWRGAAPAASVALIYGPVRGSYTLPPESLCPGVVLGLGNGPRFLARVRSGPDGSGAVEGTTGPNICGGFMQLLDLYFCNTSNVVGVQ